MSATEREIKNDGGRETTQKLSLEHAMLYIHVGSGIEAKLVEPVQRYWYAFVCVWPDASGQK